MVFSLKPVFGTSQDIQNLNKCSVSIVFLYFLYILATPYRNNIRNNISVLLHCSD